MTHFMSGTMVKMDDSFLYSAIPDTEGAGSGWGPWNEPSSVRVSRSFQFQFSRVRIQRRTNSQQRSISTLVESHHVQQKQRTSQQKPVRLQPSTSSPVTSVGSMSPNGTAKSITQSRSNQTGTDRNYGKSIRTWKCIRCQSSPNGRTTRE